VRQTPAHQHRAAVDLFTRALHDNPLLAYCEPDPERRPRFIHALYDCTVRHWSRTGTLHHQPEVACLWGEPDCLDMSLLDQARCGMWKLPLQATRRSLRRLARHEHDAHRTLRPMMSPGTSYMLALAVAPTCMGRGHGTRMLRSAFATMRGRYTACVFRTERRELVTWFEREGCTCHHHVAPSSGLAFWTVEKRLGAPSA
jgi:ribosomal protein S18 acetylase RimI-like enzyme